MSRIRSQPIARQPASDSVSEGARPTEGQALPPTAPAALPPTAPAALPPTAPAALRAPGARLDLGGSQTGAGDALPPVGRPRRRPRNRKPELEVTPFHRWPDPSEALRLDWHRIPERYRAGSHPDEILTLYRGTTAGQTERGMRAHAFRQFGFAELRHAQELATAEPEVLARSIDRFTSSSELSPFLPAAWTHEGTRSFSTEDREVYTLKVPAHRVLVDGDDTGNLREALILGAVLPHEIEGGPAPSASWPAPWADLAEAWQLKQMLAHGELSAGHLTVDTTRRGRRVDLEVPNEAKKFEGALRAAIEGVGKEALLGAARAQKTSQAQVLTVSSDAASVDLLFQTGRRGLGASSDKEATYYFRVLPEGARAAAQAALKVS